MRQIANTLSNEFSLTNKMSESIICLFEEGVSVPFIARYRKDMTGGMSDVNLRRFHDRWLYLVELYKRQHSILESLKSIMPYPLEVVDKIKRAETKTELEDLYAPFKKTRKTNADLARGLGLGPLAERLWVQSGGDERALVAIWLKSNHDVSMSLEGALKGAQEIIMETLSMNSDLLKKGRTVLLAKGELVSKVIRGKQEIGDKYKDYFDYQEPIKKVPPHRLLALFRGKKESMLKLGVRYSEAGLEKEAPSWLNIPALNNLFSTSMTSSSPLTKRQHDYLSLAWQGRLFSKLEADALSELKERAEEGAIKVFADNLKDLLMSAPAGECRVLGVDPGFRNGIKLAVIDKLAQVKASAVIYPFSSDKQAQAARDTLRSLLKTHQINWLAIGNGTASRETEAFCADLIKSEKLDCKTVVVSEAGASIYSASEVAIAEFPDLDVTIRGAISIARRFQDPLAELVKIEPQAIGVGQYQHDVKPSQLAKSLSAVVEDCVNKVGVDVNLASASLLSYVSGLSVRLAQNIVDYRAQKGRIESRHELLSIKGIGEKCFEQCAGFIRVLNGKEPLDASAVHPESYCVVKQMATRLGVKVSELMRNSALLNQLKSEPDFATQVGSYTFTDILDELSKPGRDPRPEFRYAAFDHSVQSMNDLHEGMTLEGVVTNVAAFGAFVDVGVHQDGLVHISQLANRFLKDPREVVRVGDVIKVVVLGVDVPRKRISLKAQGI
ncbi:30S ribosomal protein S1 [Marinomonas spartinae]|uniref:Tex family protein n=1 Tax=Marinomonas spartinae TaxID=1792290 RepID=UPI00080913FC|nr:Tex family protein [Marinomonas spartinae]SBS40408.1 30S ribosomal protein S1 [Marinomonas spartinae]